MKKTLVGILCGVAAVCWAQDGRVRLVDPQTNQPVRVVGGALTVTGLDGGSLQTREPALLYVSQDALLDGRAARTYVVLGRRNQGWSSTSVLGDCVQYLDTSQPLMNPVSGATTYYLISDSANDVDGGTGARTVRVTSLPADAGEEVTQTWTLNGTTAVNIGAGYDFFQFMEVGSLGTSEVSAGNISISSAAAGLPTVAQTVEYIAAGGNRSLSGRYKIPPTSTGYMLS